MRFLIRLCFSLFIFFLSNTLLFADAGKALKLLEKRDYQKLEEYLQKNLEKDSLAPGIKYVYSKMLLDTGYVHYHIDSAYFLINDALYCYTLIDEKEIEKLLKDGITDSVMLLQKTIVEERGFERAKNIHTIESYDNFINLFKSAKEVDSAVFRRNEIAFVNALNENTYQAFAYFLETYPDAIQANEAKKKYEQLLFKAKTGEGKLADYVNFIQENPNTPHRNEAELEILQLSTADNKESSFIWFIENYPHSLYKKRATDFLFYKLLTKHQPEEIILNYSYFTENDSINKIVKMRGQSLIPLFENGKYSFIGMDGRPIQGLIFDSIPPKLICGNFSNDYIEGYINDSLFLTSLDGYVFYKGPKGKVKDLQGGFLFLNQNRQQMILHKSGLNISDLSFDQIEFVESSFLKFRINDKWGLLSVMGRQILPPEYDNIAGENGFIILKRGEHLAITNSEQLKQKLQGEEVSFFFIYDDYFSIDDHHLIVISDEKEALLDPQLQIVLKLKKHKIDQFFGGWIEESDSGFKLYDNDFKPLSGEYYSRILKDQNKIAFRLKGLWGISFAGQAFSQELYFDSVYFLHKNITLLFNQSNTYVRFNRDSLVKLNDYQNITLLQPQSIAHNEGSPAGYLLIKNSKGWLQVIDENGHEVLKGKFDEIEALGNEYLVVTKNHKKGLYQSTGKQLLKTTYQGISNYNQGYVSTMLNNKFGIYHYQNELLLSAKHPKTLKPFGQQYFLSESKDKYAFVDMNNDFISDYQFLEIKYWNDTSALVKTDDYWQVFDIKNNKVVIDEITFMEEIPTLGEDRLLLITKNNQNGIIGSMEGVIIEPTFNDIINVGTKVDPVFFAEKYIKEADFYIVIYYKRSGEILKKQVYTDDEYWKIYCPE